MTMDGTKTQTDLKLGSGKEGTPKETYSKEEVAKLVTEAKTSALADVGRFRAEATKALTAATKAEERIKAIEQARIDAELESHKDDPAELRRIRAEQKTKKAEDDLATANLELTEHKEKLTKYETESKEANLSQIVREIATRVGVDPEKLSKHAKATDGSSGAIEDIAKDLPKVTSAKPGFKPDSNRSLGGNLTWEAVRAAYIKDPYDPATKERYLEMKAQRR